MVLMDTMYSLEKTGRVMLLKDLLFLMYVQIYLRDTCNCFGTSFCFLIPSMMMQCYVYIVHFLACFIQRCQLPCSSAHQHILVIIGMFYSLRFCTPACFFVLLVSLWMDTMCSWKCTWCHAVNCNLQTIIKWTKFFSSQIKDVGAITHEVALNLLRYPLTLVCS